MSADLHADDFALATVRRWRRLLWGLAGLLLLVPFVAMQFTREVQWSGADFLVFGALLALAGAVVEVAVRVSRRRAFVLGVLCGTGLLFLLVWAELAVGVFS